MCTWYNIYNKWTVRLRRAGETMIGKKWLTACGIVVFWLISMMCQAVSIIYDNTWRDAYGQVLERTVFSLDECTGHDDYIMELFTDTDVTAMEAYDIQATVLQKNTRYSYYWYPHYMATVVLAVSDDCPYDITGWHSLQTLPVTVCILSSQPQYSFSVQAMSYGLGRDVSGQLAVQALKKIHEEGRFQLDTLTGFNIMQPYRNRPAAQVYVLYDYQARQWQRRGAPIHIVVPDEGTLAFQKGLLSKIPLVVDDARLADCLADAAYRTEPMEGAVQISDQESFFVSADLISHQMLFHVFHVYEKNVLTGTNNMLWYMAALFVTILWGCRLRRHVIQPRMRNAYAGLTLVLCGWVLLRMYKLMLPGYAVDLIRWSWYSYYLFFGLLVSLIVWIGYMASQPDWHPECPPWLRLLFSYNLVLAVLVCTNDIHQWAFILPDIAGDANSYHGNGPLYYLLAVSYGAEFLVVNFWLCYASWKQHVQRSFRLILPFLCCLFYGGYIVGYLMKIPFCRISELVLTTVVWTLIWLEVVMRIRIIPTNEGYIEFFRQSRLAIQLCDDSGRVAYASRDINNLPLEDMEIQTMPIRGGWVRWYRDVRHLRQQKRNLSLVAQALERSYHLLRREEEIQRQVIHQEVSRRIYAELEQVISSKRERIAAYMKALQSMKPGIEADAIVSHLNVMVCYLKKRCILLLRGKEKGILEVRELSLAVSESQHYMTVAGLRGMATVRLPGTIPDKTALFLYDMFEEIGEASIAHHEPYWICHFSETGRAWSLSVMLEDRPEGSDWLPRALAGSTLPEPLIYDRLEYGRRLTVSIGKESYHD